MGTSRASGGTNAIMEKRLAVTTITSAEGAAESSPARLSTGLAATNNPKSGFEPDD